MISRMTPPQKRNTVGPVSWWTYVVQTSGTESPKTMAAQTKIDGPNFSKWKAGQVPKPPMVAQFARSYGRPVLEAFVAAGFLTPQEAKQRPAAAPSLDSLSDDELLAEVRSRLTRAKESTHAPDTSSQPKQGQGRAQSSSPGSASGGRRAAIGGEPDPELYVGVIVPDLTLNATVADLTQYAGRSGGQPMPAPLPPDAAKVAQPHDRVIDASQEEAAKQDRETEQVDVEPPDDFDQDGPEGGA